MRGLNKPWAPILLLALLLLSACAHTGGAQGTENREPANVDPWESFNRSMFRFNDKMDEAVIKPVARGYKKVVPSGIRRGVGNVFLNLNEPTTIVNDLLQGKGNQAAHDFMRFVVNSTFGLLGWFDLATPMGMERHEEDFGQTFSVWGISHGPYLVLPLLGPSTLSDGIGLVPSTLYTDPRYYAGNTASTYAIVGFNAIDTRARLLGASKVEALQLDPYVFRRETYLQRRERLVYDGNPPQADDFLDEDWE